MGQQAVPRPGWSSATASAAVHRHPPRREGQGGRGYGLAWPGAGLAPTCCSRPTASTCPHRSTTDPARSPPPAGTSPKAITPRVQVVRFMGGQFCWRVPAGPISDGWASHICILRCSRARRDRHLPQPRLPFGSWTSWSWRVVQHGAIGLSTPWRKLSAHECIWARGRPWSPCCATPPSACCTAPGSAPSPPACATSASTLTRPSPSSVTHPRLTHKP